MISSKTLGLGHAGDMTVNVIGQASISGEDGMGNDSRIVASSNSTGAGGFAGRIHFNAGSLEFSGGAYLSATTHGLGKGGDIVVKVSGPVIISGEDAEGTDSGVFANSASSGLGGSAGNIQFAVGSLQMLGGGTMTSSTFGLGKGGDVKVKVSGQAIISGEDAEGTRSGVFTNSDSSASGGSAGNIQFAVGSLQMLGGGTMTSSTFGLGKGGDVAVKVSGQAIISGENSQGGASEVFASSNSGSSGGSAGSIHFSAASLQMLGGAQIVSSTAGLGNAGDITLNVSGGATLSGSDVARHISGVFVNSNSRGSGGHAGNIHFIAVQLQMAGRRRSVRRPRVRAKGDM